MGRREAGIRGLVMLATTSVFALTAGLAWAQKAGSSRRPVPAIFEAQVPRRLAAQPLTVTPSPITFTSSNPDASVAGSGLTTVSFSLPSHPGSYTVYAQAAAANFTGCNKPPASSITMTCSKASNATCVTGSVTLTTSGTAVATIAGHQGETASFTVTYTFQDNWNYQVGAACSLSVNYYWE